MIDVRSSTNTILDSGEEFIGNPTKVGDLVRINVLTQADAAGTLCIEFSADRVTWHCLKPFDVKVNRLEHIESGLIGNWYRVRYINGTSAQTVFWLVASTYYGQSVPIPTTPVPTPP